MNRISWDSMEPKYKDGDKVFVSPDPAERGQIAICIYESEAYIKKIGDHELISLNPAYPPIKVTNPESFFCVGTVLGKCDQSYFENDV